MGPFIYILCIVYNMKTLAQPIAFDERRKKRFDRNQKTHPDVSSNSDAFVCVCVCLYFYIYIYKYIDTRVRTDTHEHTHTHARMLYIFFHSPIKVFIVSSGNSKAPILSSQVCRRFTRNTISRVIVKKIVYIHTYIVLWKIITLQSYTIKYRSLAGY